MKKSEVFTNLKSKVIVLNCLCVCSLSVSDQNSWNFSYSQLHHICLEDFNLFLHQLQYID